MPVGRIYQAPALTVPRQTPVYGFNGIKAAAVVASATISYNPELMVTGRSVRNQKSKSPSPLLNNNSNNNNNNNNSGHNSAARTVKPRTGTSRVRATSKTAQRRAASQENGGTAKNGGGREQSWSPSGEEEDDNATNNNKQSDDDAASSSPELSRLSDGLVRHPTRLAAALTTTAHKAEDNDNNNSGAEVVETSSKLGSVRQVHRQREEE